MRALTLPIFLFLFIALKAEAACVQNKSCLLQLQKNFIQNSLQAIEATQQEKEFQTFLATSLQQRETALEDKNFQDVVTNFQVQVALPEVQSKYLSGNKNQSGDLYIFVSFSLGEKALLNLANEAKLYEATLVLRGFKDNSYAQTVKTLQKIIQKTMSSGDRPGEGQGFIIDPELFSLFSVTAVPTYVLSRPFQQTLESQSLEPQTLESKTLERTQTPIHDRLQGHVSLQYALEMFAKEGDLQNEAQFLLEKPGKGGSQ